MSVGNKNLNSFINVVNLENVIKTSCFKSNNSSCIDLILTNKKKLLKKCCTVEIGISDHHLHPLGTILKSKLNKSNPKTKF